VIFDNLSSKILSYLELRKKISSRSFYIARADQERIIKFVNCFLCPFPISPMFQSVSFILLCLYSIIV
jgi:hypothetical protein